MGRHAEARETFERLLAPAQRRGLLSEEYGTTTGRMVGNFPQAFRRVPLIATARTVSSALAATEARADEGLG